MRFSIRSLLAIMLLCSIVFPMVIGLNRIRRNELLRMQLAKEIESERQALALDDPKRQRIRQHWRDELDSMQQLRDKAEQQFDRIQLKYSSIETRSGDVLSVRTVPQLSVDDQRPPVAFRLQVPSGRPVYLKYALVPSDGGSQWSKQLDEIDRAEQDSGYQHPGPYEIRLEPGERIVTVSTGLAIGNVMPITVRLDDETLLNTTFESDQKPTAGAYHVSGRRQMDFAPGRDLPWLLNTRIRLEDEDGKNKNAAFYGCLWLSERSGQYPSFPTPKDSNEATSKRESSTEEGEQ